MSLERIAFCALFAPLIGFIIGMLVRNTKKFGESVTVAGMAIALTATLLIWWETKGVLHLNIHLLDWIKIGTLKTAWGIRIDPLTMVMLGVVNIVSFLVHIYSLSYMVHDPSRPRFMAYLSFLHS